MHEHVVISFAAIGLAALVCQLAAWLLKLPAILFLLLVGVFAGPIAGWLNPDVLLGDLLFPIVSLLVAIILFEGSLTLRFNEIKGLERVVRRLVTVGLLVTWAITAVVTQWLIEVGWQIAMLFGAITVVTGPTVIVPILRMVRPSARIANILRWEGIVIDPIGALLAVIAFEFVISEQAASALPHTFAIFARTLLVGGLLGAVTGYLFGLALRHHLLPEYLQNLTALMLLIAVFAVSNHAQEESGLLAVTIMGMWLANMRDVDTREILNFKETLSLVFISGLFILLGARLDLQQLQSLGANAVLILAAILFVARPLKVALATLGSDLSWRERAMIAWIAPRGIVAAAIASLFSLKLESQGLKGADVLVPLTFSVIIGTVVLQSLTARALAIRLGVAEPEPRGFLVIGANRVARLLAKGLADNGYRVLLTDTHRDYVQQARMAGLDTYFGNPLSEHADRHLDLVGLGRLLAAAPVSETNTLAALRYRSEFGPANLFLVQTAGERDNAKHRPAQHSRPGKTLFARDVTFSKLASLINQGATPRTTLLTESFDFNTYQAKHGTRAIPLFAIDPKERLHAFHVGNQLVPQAGWKIIGLVTNAPATEAAS